MGLNLGSVGESVFGGASSSPGQLRILSGAPEIGTQLARLLYERLNTPPSETESFRLGKEAIGESLGRTAEGARQRLGEGAVSRGYFDSGALFSQEQAIDRSEMQAFGSGLRELLLGLEDRRTQGALPFLQTAVGELLGSGQLQQGAEQFNASQFFNMLNSSGNFMRGASSFLDVTGMAGGGGGPSQDAVTQYLTNPMLPV